MPFSKINSSTLPLLLIHSYPARIVQTRLLSVFRALQTNTHPAKCQADNRYWNLWDKLPPSFYKRDATDRIASYPSLLPTTHFHRHDSHTRSHLPQKEDGHQNYDKLLFHSPISHNHLPLPQNEAKRVFVPNRQEYENYGVTIPYGHVPSVPDNWESKRNLEYTVAVFLLQPYYLSPNRLH